MRIETFNELSARAKAGLLRSLRNHHFEEMPDGRLMLTKDRAIIGGVFVHSLNGGPDAFDPNTVVTEGRNHVLDVVLRAQPQNANWYMSLFTGNVTPQATWTAANYASNATELTAYTESTRPAYTLNNPAASGTINNYADKAGFTINGSATIYGGALLSSNVKSGTAGKLLAAARFNASRAVEEEDVLQVGYQITLNST